VQQTFVLHTQNSMTFVLRTQKRVPKKQTQKRRQKKVVRKVAKKVARKAAKKLAKKHAKKAHCHIHNKHANHQKKLLKAYS
jgi:hypothetical protein